MGLSAIVPIIWGLVTDNMHAAEWMTIAAECICWVELKGSYSQRFRILVGGAFLAVFSVTLGSLTGFSVVLSVIAMLGVGFVSALFKNLGERGAGLSVTVFVLFIIGNAFPATDAHTLTHRVGNVAIGGAWVTIVGLFATYFAPVMQPYRRSIALIWEAVAVYSDAIARGWDGVTTRLSIRDRFLKEKDIRTAIDNSLQLYSELSHQVNEQDRQEANLAHFRKATSLAALHVVSVNNELESINVADVSQPLQLKLNTLLKAITNASRRMAMVLIDPKPEEFVLLRSRLMRINKLCDLIEEALAVNETAPKEVIERVIQLARRSVRIMDSAQKSLEENSREASVFRSYSLLKTLFILHPKHWIRNLRLLFNFNTFMVRYAARTAFAAALAMFLYKWLHIDRGYWIAFTVIIVIQPYFGATFKKAVDRVIGTVLGGFAGGVLLNLPFAFLDEEQHAASALYIKAGLLFFCFMFMVYFSRKKYAVAAFFVTLSVVILFDVEDVLNPSLIWWRAGATFLGAAIAVIAGFALLPNWDKKWIPVHFAQAVLANYQYFISTFFHKHIHADWSKQKRTAESQNSNLFDSFNRLTDEPNIKKVNIDSFFQLITYNIRITRELSSINIEYDAMATYDHTNTDASQQALVLECRDWFVKVLIYLKEAGYLKDEIEMITDEQEMLVLNGQQVMDLEKMLIELKAISSDLSKVYTN